MKPLQALMFWQSALQITAQFHGFKINEFMLLFTLSIAAIFRSELVPSAAAYVYHTAIGVYESPLASSMKWFQIGIGSKVDE